MASSAMASMSSEFREYEQSEPLLKESLCVCVCVYEGAPLV